MRHRLVIYILRYSTAELDLFMKNRASFLKQGGRKQTKPGELKEHNHEHIQCLSTLLAIISVFSRSSPVLSNHFFIIFFNLLAHILARFHDCSVELLIMQVISLDNLARLDAEGFLIDRTF